MIIMIDEKYIIPIPNYIAKAIKKKDINNSEILNFNLTINNSFLIGIFPDGLPKTHLTDTPIPCKTQG